MERRGTEDFSARSGPSTRALNERPARFARWRRVFLDLLSHKRGDLLSTACNGAVESSVIRIQGVFHRQGWGRVSRNLQRGDGGFRLSRGRREGRFSGWAGTLSPRDSGGVPRVLGPPLGDRDGDGPVGSEYSTCVHVRSRGWCHFLPSGITFTLALSHRRERGQDAPPWPPPVMDSGSRRPE